MALELQEAQKIVDGNTGNKLSLCQTCAIDVDGHSLHLGLCQRTVGTQFPSCGIRFSRSLSTIISESPSCWTCAWLRALLQHRSPAVLTSDHAGAWDQVKVHVATGYVYPFELNQQSGKQHYTLMRMIIMVDPRQIGLPFEQVVSLQHSNVFTANIADPPARTDSDLWQRLDPYSARLRPQQADLSLLLRWTQLCLVKHGSQCRSPSLARPEGLRMIDVRRRCIVTPVTLCPYVALSYCWGGPQLHCLTEGNLVQYSTAGALSTKNVPRVIWDAMELTVALDQQYLWVDSMCIVQDSVDDMLRALDMMGSLYEHAEVTIINAATSTAVDPSGLPGVGGPAVRRQHTSFQINGVQLAETLDPDHGQYSGKGITENAHWSTRGWTFQEAALSRRCIIITAEQIYWQCQVSTWCEGSYWECENENFAVFRSFLGDTNIKTLDSVSTMNHWMRVYVALMNDYMTRTFGSEGDWLHGLTGVLKKVEASTGTGFIWAIPQNRLEQGLTFVLSPKARRREARHVTRAANGTTLSRLFPSWSWIGWSGPSSLKELVPRLEIGTLGLQFYRLDGDKKPILVNQPDLMPTVDASTDARTNELLRYPLHAVHEWLDSQRQQITIKDIPGALRDNSNLMGSLLCFWTSVATFHIEPRGLNSFYNEPSTMLSGGGTHFLALWPGIGDDFVFPSEGKFIVVNAEKERPSRLSRLTLKLLFVELDKSIPEICYRKALITTVGEEDWSKCTHRKWELVLLA